MSAPTPLSPSNSSGPFLQGWSRYISIPNAQYELIFTTDGTVFYVPLWASMGTDVAKNIGRQFGILGAIAGEAAGSNMREKARAEGMKARNAQTIAERIRQKPTHSRTLPSNVIELMYVGEKGFGFGKKRNGVYLREGIPHVSPPRGFGRFYLPENDPDWNAAMKGWCDAAGVRCEGFAIGEAPDPVWLEGPQIGEVSGTAADAFAQMSRTLLPMRNQLDVEAFIAQTAAQTGQTADQNSGSNPMAIIAVGLGIGAGGNLMLSLVLGLIIPGAGAAACLSIPMSIAAVVLGLLGLKKAKGDFFETGKTPSIVGIAMGAVGFVASIVLPVLASLIRSMMQSF